MTQPQQAVVEEDYETIKLKAKMLDVMTQIERLQQEMQRLKMELMVQQKASGDGNDNAV